VTRRANQAALLLAALPFACTAQDKGEPRTEPSTEQVRAAEPKGLRPGGDTTVALGPSPSFVVPAGNLSEADKARYYAGKALATQPWVRAPTQTDARDGLGPLYHARSCLACHVKGGRGQAAAPDGTALATLVRLSRPGQGPHGGPVPDPVYGPQRQPQSTSLSHQLRGQTGAEANRDQGAPPEADVRVTWTVKPFVYPDGAQVELREPTLSLEPLGYGPMASDTRASLRHTPALVGMGLLELIPQADIDALADPEDRDGDGISGRVNQVWDPEANAVRPGRFGLKANQPSVRVQVAAALSGDMGLSTPVFPEQSCTPSQTRCLEAPNGNDADGFEVGESLLASMVYFTMSVGVPERRRPDDPTVLRGQALFEASGCASCHTPHYVTGSDPAYAHLSAQDIWPYSDLLLHDMGEGLADGREDFAASGREWRTPPLWGAGLARAMHKRVGFLHDGRARTIEEAIVWHDGEARSSRDRFAELENSERRALVAFVRSL
jgi:CxxC motif-containing protein (DUF1111 family)